MTRDQEENQRVERIRSGQAGLFEVVDFIMEKLAAGMLQRDVAVLLGKSQAYVSNHVRLHSLPPLTADAVGRGRLSDLTGIAELAKAEREAPDRVRQFLAETPKPRRAEIVAFRREASRSSSESERQEDNPARWICGKVAVEYGARWATLVLKKKPRDEKHAWLRYLDGREEEVPVADLRIRAIVAG